MKGVQWTTFIFLTIVLKKLKTQKNKTGNQNIFINDRAMMNVAFTCMKLLPNTEPQTQVMLGYGVSPYGETTGLHI